MNLEIRAVDVQDEATLQSEGYGIAAFGRLLGMLRSEIPLGDLDLSDSEWTPERLRAAEQRCVGIGRHILAVLAS